MLGDFKKLKQLDYNWIYQDAGRWGSITFWSLLCNKFRSIYIHIIYSYAHLQKNLKVIHFGEAFKFFFKTFSNTASNHFSSFFFILHSQLKPTYYNSIAHLLLLTINFCNHKK